jgi:hypothetical protein
LPYPGGLVVAARAAATERRDYSTLRSFADLLQKNPPGDSGRYNILLRHRFAGAADSGGEVSEFGQSIVNSQDGFRIIEVDGRFEGQSRRKGAADVD